jgi:hypothetical protein
MANYKGTWTGWTKKIRPHGIQEYITPKDRAFDLFSGGPAVLGNVRDVIAIHERSVLWEAALKATGPCEKPYLLRRDTCETLPGEEPTYEEVEVSCFEFIQLYANDRPRVEPTFEFGEDHSFEYCVVCDVARRICEREKEE